MVALLKTTAAVLAAKVLTAVAQLDCIQDSYQEEFTMYMPYQDLNVTVPIVPTTTSLYAYATENALVAVPEACVDEYSDFFEGGPNFADRTGGQEGMYYFRVSNPTRDYAHIVDMAGCACGLVILLHGSSGATWQSVAYARMMSANGHVVVMPDSMAMPDSMGLKGKTPVKSTSELNTTDYWGSSNPYSGSCSSFSKPFCYSTKVDNILEDAAAYRAYVERNYLIRKLELDYFVETQTELLSSFSKVFLLGRSEGAYVAARYHHSALDAKLSGRIISGYSCDFNYFSSCAEHARVCGDRCRKDVPQLNIIGESDYYFGAQEGSVSAQVANSAGGYGGPLTGNCRAAYDSQSFENGIVVVFPCGHSLIPTADNTVRSIFADFVNNADPPARWASLNGDWCSFDAAENVWRCADSGENTFVHSSSWGTDVVSSWSFLGTYASCPITASAALRLALARLGSAAALAAALAWSM